MNSYSILNLVVPRPRQSPLQDERFTLIPAAKQRDCVDRQGVSGTDFDTGDYRIVNYFGMDNIKAILFQRTLPRRIVCIFGLRGELLDGEFYWIIGAKPIPPRDHSSLYPLFKLLSFIPIVRVARGRDILQLLWDGYLEQCLVRQKWQQL